MSSFTASVRSAAVVPADRERIWDVLTDPVLLPQLTPLLSGIDVEGDLWRWHLGKISALGVEVSPVFTERMVLQRGERIDYHHEPPTGAREYAGAEGNYLLSDVDGGTRLEINLALTIDLPLPRLSAPAVEAVMSQTMKRTGDRFSANLLRHLRVA